MNYLLDGYNILFHYFDSKRDFSSQREDLITYLQARFSSRELSGTLVFDGSHRREEESGRQYKKPLSLVYTPKGQSADAYIIEQVELSKNPGEITVVTHDSGLKRQIRALKAHSQTPEIFFLFLQKKTAKKEKKNADSPKEIQRLLKIFQASDSAKRRDEEREI